MTDILIGTSGYDYPEWKGVFYPEDLPRKDFLSYYATQFNTVELNNTFYNMPTAERMQNFYDRSGGNLFFSIKANRLLTHDIDRNWQTVAEDFKNAVQPLNDKGLLSAVLFQLSCRRVFITQKKTVFTFHLFCKTLKAFPVQSNSVTANG